MIQIGNKLKQLRKNKQLTQSELSKKTGIHWSLISKYERSITEPSTDSLYKIAKVLEVSVDFLLEDDISVYSKLKDKELLYLMNKIESKNDSNKKIIKKIIKILCSLPD